MIKSNDVKSCTAGKRKFLFTAFALVAFLFSCKKEIVQNNIYDNVYYEVTPQVLYENNAQKNKQKTSLQYISILYTDLFNQSIPSSNLVDLSELILSIGDKGIANDMILQRMLTLPGLQIPTQAQMQADMDGFISATYQRFYLRNPTAYEKIYLKNLILADSSLTPQIIYMAFALSNEYIFY
ncbi:MAG TPA: hypothetical protein DCQ93_01990 [Bacteroidetes bacterium]|nr:hypothetical protein [Bacteroidota bacterium]